MGNGSVRRGEEGMGNARGKSRGPQRLVYAPMPEIPKNASIHRRKLLGRAGPANFWATSISGPPIFEPGRVTKGSVNSVNCNRN